MLLLKMFCRLRVLPMFVFTLHVSTVGCALSSTALNANLVISLSKEYFIIKEVKNLIFFVCFEPKDQVNFYKEFSDIGAKIYLKDIKSSELDCFKKDLNVFLDWKSTDLGIVLDFSCSNGEAILELASEIGAFQSYNKWLIFDTRSSKSTCKRVPLTHRPKTNSISPKMCNKSFFERSENTSKWIMKNFNKNIFEDFDLEVNEAVKGFLNESSETEKEGNNVYEDCIEVKEMNDIKRKPKEVTECIQDSLWILSNMNLSINADVVVVKDRYDEMEETNKMVKNTEEIQSNTNIPLVKAHDTVSNKSEPIFDLYDVYKTYFMVNETLNVTQIAWWIMGKGLQVNDALKYLRTDFNQIAMRIAVVVSTEQNRPLLELFQTPGYTFGISSVTKMNGALVGLLGQIYNFRLEFTKTQVWGGIMPDGNQFGMMGSLQRGEVEVGAGIRSLPERTPFADYVFKTWDLSVIMYFRSPSESEAPQKAACRFLEPLSSSSWLGILVCFLLTSAALAVSLLCHCRLSSRSRMIVRACGDSISLAVFSTFAAICQQVFESGPQKKISVRPTSEISKNAFELSTVSLYFSGRLISLVGFLFSLLVYNYYTSSVVSSLLSPSALPPFDLQDLIDTPIELTFEDIGYTRSLFTNPNFAFIPTISKTEQLMVSKKVKTSKRKQTIFLKPEEGIFLVKQGGFAYQTEPETALPLIAKSFDPEQICDLQELTMLTDPIFLVTQKDSPFKETFSVGLSKLLETGHVRRLEKMIQTQKLECSRSKIKPSPVPFARVFPALLLLSWSALAALLLLGLEILSHKYC